MSTRQRSRSIRFPAATALVVLLTAALVPIVISTPPAQASPARSGAILTITATAGSYSPGQSPAVILSDVNQTASLTWSSGNPRQTNIPVAWTAKLLDSESPVVAVLRRPGAPATSDAYALSLSHVTLDETGGLEATATAGRPVPELSTAGLDHGAPPDDLDAVRLSVYLPRVQKGADDSPVEPPGAGVLEKQQFVFVTGTFPVGTQFTYTAKGGDCLTNQESPNANGPTATLRFDVVTDGHCAWEPSVARWDVEIIPQGVNPINALWLYITVNQFGPDAWHSACTTINQPKRPTCSGSTTWVGNSTTVKIYPG
jgi:hypothetical protein